MIAYRDQIQTHDGPAYTICKSQTPQPHQAETSADNLLASKRSSESQLQGVIKRQKTYELEASEQQKNVQAAAEFWAVMRHTHGFQNQAAPANEVTTSTEPGTSSRQQAEASPKNHRNPKRRRGSDNEYTEPNTPNTPLGDIDTLKDTSTSWPDITRPAKRTKEYTSEYAESNTTKTPDDDTPVVSSGNAESHTANEEKKQRQTSPTTPPRQKKHNDLVSRDKTTYGVLVTLWRARASANGCFD
jgi:hypothetical protein